MSKQPAPTERELDILKVLWDRGEATVREVYEELSQNLPIVQNTVQAFLRTMEEKGQVRHRVEGRTFIYQPVIERESTNTRLASRLLQRVFDGAIDQLVHSLFSEQTPSEAELQRLETLIAEMKTSRKPSGKRKGGSK
jgi:predicted transcriptional regulator